MQDPSISWENPDSWTDRSACETLSNEFGPVEICVEMDFSETDVMLSKGWLSLPRRASPFFSFCIPIEGRKAEALELSRSGKWDDISSLVVTARYDFKFRSGWMKLYASADEFLAGEYGLGIRYGSSENMDPPKHYEGVAAKSLQTNLSLMFREGLSDRFSKVGWSSENGKPTWRGLCEE
jgi:hypothetical protein